MPQPVFGPVFYLHPIAASDPEPYIDSAPPIHRYLSLLLLVLNPLSLPTSRSGRHRRVPAVLPEAHVFLRL